MRQKWKALGRIKCINLKFSTYNFLAHFIISGYENSHNKKFAVSLNSFPTCFYQSLFVVVSRKVLTFTIHFIKKKKNPIYTAVIVNLETQDIRPEKSFYSSQSLGLQVKKTNLTASTILLPHSAGH